MFFASSVVLHSYTHVIEHVERLHVCIFSTMFTFFPSILTSYLKNRTSILSIGGQNDITFSFCECRWTNMNKRDWASKSITIFDARSDHVAAAAVASIQSIYRYRYLSIYWPIVGESILFFSLDKTIYNEPIIIGFYFRIRRGSKHSILVFQRCLPTLWYNVRTWREVLM